MQEVSSIKQSKKTLDNSNTNIRIVSPSRRFKPGL
jgi:hypothetical protein